jgi:hypothetical protein
MYEHNIVGLKLTEKNEEIATEAMDFLSSHLMNMVPMELSEVIDDSIYGKILNIENCLEDFLSTYEPKPL